MQRVVIPELLDTDSGTAQEIGQSLNDLRVINRWFGGTSTTRALIEKVSHRIARRELSLLEVAAGSGDVPQGAARDLAKRGIKVDVTLLDRAASHLNGLRSAVVADALALPFRDASFDLVSCSLFAHHLEPADLRKFFKEALRVCRVAVLVNDLRRGRVHLAFIYAGLPIFRSRITRHDSVASVKRAYTPEEMRSIVAKSGACSCEISRHYLFRMGVIVWKAATPTTGRPVRPSRNVSVQAEDRP
jgi:ubiquinone/menaquinone biosynthesis C-methylase UbiE